MTEEERQRIARERSFELIREWHRRALRADSMAVVLGD